MKKYKGKAARDLVQRALSNSRDFSKVTLFGLRYSDPTWIQSISRIKREPKPIVIHNWPIQSIIAQMGELKNSITERLSAKGIDVNETPWGDLTIHHPNSGEVENIITMSQDEHIAMHEG